ncbi:MAG: hypothetical protein FRX49_09001 [Trebouxia sp. A1-2]|nr:MAG: hypothetical protein FRX49_09001 [Trebouxia sp. A1-2]
MTSSQKHMQSECHLSLELADLVDVVQKVGLPCLHLGTFPCSRTIGKSIASQTLPKGAELGSTKGRRPLLPEPCSKVAGGELVPAELDANPKGGIDRGLAAESALRVLASGAEGGAADVLAAAALICPNRLLVGIPNAGAVNGLAAAADWLNDLLDGIPKAGAANKLPAVLVCPNKPPGAPAVMDARLYDGRACEVDEADAEDWKRLAVADAAGNPPGCEIKHRRHDKKGEVHLFFIAQGLGSPTRCITLSNDIVTA